VIREVEALCNQCSLPSTRNPVSAKWASCAPPIAAATCSVNAWSSATAAVAAETVPWETGGGKQLAHHLRRPASTGGRRWNRTAVSAKRLG